MITIYCLITVAGLTGQQKLSFEFDKPQASRFLAGYGHNSGIDRTKLQRLACQDLDYTLSFLEETAE